MNNISILGRLGKDVEVTQSKDNKSIGKFSVGVTRKFNKDVTDWFNCVSFGKQADTIAQYFNKGDLIALTGEIQFGSYENKEGNKVYTTTLVVNTFDFCGSSKKKEQNNDYDNEPLGEPDYSNDSMPF